jgi:hypothetical protein
MEPPIQPAPRTVPGKCGLSHTILLNQRGQQRGYSDKVCNRRRRGQQPRRFKATSPLIIHHKRQENVRRRVKTRTLAAIYLKLYGVCLLYHRSTQNQNRGWSGTGHASALVLARIRLRARAFARAGNPYYNAHSRVASSPGAAGVHLLGSGWTGFP